MLSIPEHDLTDHIIDRMLTTLQADGRPDPLDPGPFPSLGFENETRGSYYMEIIQGAARVTIWRIVGASDGPETYRINMYHELVYNGIVSWGAHGTGISAESLIQVQGLVHYFFTSKGNEEKDDE